MTATKNARPTSGWGSSLVAAYSISHFDERKDVRSDESTEDLVAVVSST